MSELLATARATGFTPLFDRKQLASVSVVGGKNFRPAVAGHRTAFGKYPVTYNTMPVDFCKNGLLIDLKDGSLLYCCNYGLMSYDEENKDWYFIDKLAVPLSGEHKWSHANVGGYDYVCCYGYGTKGIKQWDKDERTLIEVTTDVVSGAMCICESKGRLVILGSGSYQWSAIGDGTDLATSLTTGAGFKPLTIVNNGTPLSVNPTGTGFIVFTTRGMCKAVEIDTTLVWQHTAVGGAEFAPLGETSMTTTGGGSVAVMTANGLYLTDGSYPEQFEPIVGRYIAKSLVNQTTGKSRKVSLWFCEIEKSLYISVSTTASIGSPFNNAFVYDFEIGEWGIMERPFYCIGNFIQTSGEYLVQQPTILDINGRLTTINNYYYNKDIPDSYDICSLTCVDPAVVYVDGIAKFSGSTTHFSENIDIIDISNKTMWEYVKRTFLESEPEELVTIDTFSDVATIDMQAQAEAVIDMEEVGESYIDMAEGSFETTNLTAGISTEAVINIYTIAEVKPVDVEMDSELVVGLFALNRENSVDRTTEITEVAQVQEEFKAEDTVVDMKNEAYTIIDMEDEDYSIIDMNIGGGSTNEYQTTITPTTDGVLANAQGELNLTEVYTKGNRRLYNAYADGLYHYITLYADGINEGFFLKNIDVTATLGGLNYNG